MLSRVRGVIMLAYRTVDPRVPEQLRSIFSGGYFTYQAHGDNSFE